MGRRGVTSTLLALCLGVWLNEPVEAGRHRRTLDRPVDLGWPSGWCPLNWDDFLIFQADGPRARLTFSVNDVAELRLDNVHVVEESALASHLRSDPAFCTSNIYDAAAPAPQPEVFSELFDFEANGWRLQDAFLSGDSAPRLPFGDDDTSGQAVHFDANGRASIDLSGLEAGTRYAVSAWWYTEGSGTLEIEVDTLDPLTMFLGQDGRFEVRATWQTQGDAGTARVVPLTADTGFFWFFGESNIEVVVKVIDGCGLNNRFWVFAAGLTDVGVVLEVKDTQTGQVRRYRNTLSTSFLPTQDTDAFATCP